MKINYVTSKTLKKECFKAAMLKRMPALFFNDIVESAIFYGRRGGKFDKDQCKREGFNLTPMPDSQAGTIVAKPGDMSVVVLSKKPLAGFVSELMNHLVQVFQSRGLNAKKDNNDILIDDRKIFGGSAVRHRGIYYAGMFFAMNNNEELVARICAQEQRVKLAAGLSDDYGMDKQYIIDAICVFANNWNETYD